MKTCMLPVILSFFVIATPAAAAPIGRYQQGTVIRMRMTGCALTHGGLMNAFGPPQAAAVESDCPEYTLLTDKVVFVIVGRSSNQLVPLAEIVDFRFEKKELAVRVDDARHETKFAIKEMILRTEWDTIQRHIENELNNPPRPEVGEMAMRNR